MSDRRYLQRVEERPEYQEEPAGNQVVSVPNEQYLVQMKDGSYRTVRRDANGPAWRDISEDEAMRLREAGLPTRLERAEENYNDTQADIQAKAQATLEALRGRGFVPEGTQGPVRLQRTQVEGAEPSYTAYSLDMRGNERKGPVSQEEARYLSGHYPEGVEEVPEGEPLVPLPLPQPELTSQQQRQVAAMLQAMRGE